MNNGLVLNSIFKIHINPMKEKISQGAFPEHFCAHHGADYH